MTDIVEFLRAQLDEDERVAEGAKRTSGAEWHPVALQSHFDARMDDHIARHDPARVLADVEAKRRILDLHEGREAPYDETKLTCTSCGYSDGWADVAFPCPTLRLLAVPFAGHPDYDEAWRP